MLSKRLSAKLEQLVAPSATVSTAGGFWTTSWKKRAAGSFSEEGTLDGLAYMDGACYSNWAAVLDLSFALTLVQSRKFGYGYLLGARAQDR